MSNLHFLVIKFGREVESETVERDRRLLREIFNESIDDACAGSDGTMVDR
jgi:hypothetical protein